jgi:hypothetical protein
MRYFVIGPTGDKYGPADVPLLNQWIAEGRLFPASIVVSEANGTQTPASTVPGLQFAPGVPPSSPVAAHMAPPTYAGAYTPPQYESEDHRLAFVGIGLGTLSIVLTFFLGWGSMLCWLSGFATSWQGRKERPALAYLGIAINLVALGVWIYVLFQEQQAIFSSTQ